MQLYPEQQRVIDEIRAHLANGVRRILVVAPCGFGKTVLSAFMVKAASGNGKRCAFSVHRRELVKQTIDTFAMAGIKHGVISAGFHPYRKARVQIASIPTWRRRIKQVGDFDIILTDEAHHSCAATYVDLMAQYPNAVHIGLTATPERLDGRGLGKHFDVIVEGPSVRWLIDNGFLAPFRLFSVPSVVTEGLHTRMGDFAIGEVIERMNASTVTGDALREYRRHAAGKRFIIFEASRERSRAAAKLFTEAGFPCAHVDGDTPHEERDRAMRDFRLGKLIGLSNVELFGEGVDVPEMECSIHCRPTQSLSMWVQQCMRPMRRAPGKVAIILDHAGNFARHGAPDADRVWTLEGRIGDGGGKSEAVSNGRACSFCYATSPPNYTRCRECGKAFPIKSRAIEEVEGELVEMGPEVAARMAEYQEAFKAYTAGSYDDFDKLVQYARDKRYRNPEGYAMHVIEGRQKKQRRSA